MKPPQQSGLFDRVWAIGSINKTWLQLDVSSARKVRRSSSVATVQHVTGTCERSTWIKLTLRLIRKSSSCSATPT
jgi:hypothetical protein